MDKARKPMGGPRPGSGRPANIEASLARLERSIAAEKQRPRIGYAEALRLWRQAERLTGELEWIMVSTPDYPETASNE